MALLRGRPLEPWPRYEVAPATKDGAGVVLLAGERIGYSEFEASAQRISSKFSVSTNHARLILSLLREGRRHV